MTTALQLRRGTTAQHAAFTGLNGEVTVDTSLNTLRVHDGATAGGTPLAKLTDIVAAIRYDTAQSLTAGQQLQARSNIAALLEPTANGIVVKTGAGTVANRSLVAGTGISIENPDGVSGNITISSTVTGGVTTVNGNSGDITAAQIAEAATAGYGYTPADSTHTHSGYVSTNMTHGAVGSLCFAYVDIPSSGTKYVPGSTIAGSLLRATGMDLTNMKSCYYSSSMSGTWRCLGNVVRVTGTSAYIAHTLFQRIS